MLAHKMPRLLGRKAVMLFWRTRMKITISVIRSLLILFMRIHGRQKNWISNWVCCWVFPLVFLQECLYFLFIPTGYFQCMQNSMQTVVFFFFFFPSSLQMFHGPWPSQFWGRNLQSCSHCPHLRARKNSTHTHTHTPIDACSNNWTTLLYTWN